MHPLPAELPPEGLGLTTMEIPHGLHPPLPSLHPYTCLVRDGFLAHTGPLTSYLLELESQDTVGRMLHLGDDGEQELGCPT